MVSSIVAPFSDPAFKDIPHTPVVTQLMRKGYRLEFDRVMYVWTKPITGTGEVVSIAYDGPTEIGADPLEAEYFVGRYSDTHMGYRQVHGLYDLTKIFHLADLLMALPVIPTDEQIDYSDDEDLSSALSNCPDYKRMPVRSYVYTHPYVTEGPETITWCGTHDQLADHIANIWSPSVMAHLRSAISLSPSRSNHQEKKTPL